MNSIPVSLNFLYFKLYSLAFLDSRFFLFSFSLTYWVNWGKLFSEFSFWWDFKIHCMCILNFKKWLKPLYASKADLLNVRINGQKCNKSGELSQKFQSNTCTLLLKSNCTKSLTVLNIIPLLTFPHLPVPFSMSCHFHSPSCFLYI